MQRNVKTLYNNIVNAAIGERVNTRHTNGITYTSFLKDVLYQQGYVENEDYRFDYDNRTLSYSVIKLKEILPLKELFHNIKNGDVIYSAWGWEQTNFDFYQVVSTTRKQIKIKKLNQDNIYDAATMSGKTTPRVNDFISNEVLIKKPYPGRDEWCVSFTHGSGRVWDGQPKNYTTYA